MKTPPPNVLAALFLMMVFLTIEPLDLNIDNPPPLCDSLFVMHEEAKNPFDNEIMKLTNFFARYNINAPFRFIIMAHWDSREYADKDPILSNRKLPVIGANDGASGVAIILTLAEILSKHPVLNIGIDLLLVDGEDQGVSGNSESFGIGTQ